MPFDPIIARRNAERFAVARFEAEIRAFIEQVQNQPHPRPSHM